MISNREKEKKKGLFILFYLDLSWSDHQVGFLSNWSASYPDGAYQGTRPCLVEGIAGKAAGAPPWDEVVCHPCPSCPQKACRAGHNFPSCLG